MSIRSRGCGIARFVSLSLSIFLCLGALTGWSRMLHPAQAQLPDTGDKAAREAQALVEALDDIDMLHSLNPLKMTPEQVGKLADAVTATKVDYDQTVTTMG